MVEEQIFAGSNFFAGASAGVNKFLSWKFSGIVLALLFVVATYAVYALALISPGLLDEQYLLAWLKAIHKLHGSSGFGGFMDWPGFENADSWGWATKFSFVFVAFFCGKNVAVFKFFMVAIHAACTALVYFCSKALCRTNAPAIISALFFAVYPLHFEASAWLGGFGAELGTFAFLLALYLYMKARQADSGWLKIAMVSVASFIAVSNSVLMWTSCLAFGLLELVYLAMPEKESEKRDLTMALIAALMPIVLVGMYIAATLGFNVNLVPEIQIKVISSCLRHMALPINEFNWQHYAAQYRFLYVVYPCLAISAIAALRVVELRRGILYAAMLCPVLLFPLAGTSGIDSTLYGERWLYAATVPFCMLLGFFAAGFASLTGRLRYPGLIACIVITLLFSNFFYRHLRNEIAANRNCARILKAAQKAMKESQQNGQLQIEILRDLPKKLSVCPSFSPFGPVVFDPATGLMRSNQVPDGRLKDLLRDNKMRENSLRWEMDLRGFLPLELQDEKATCPDNMKIEELAFRLMPKLEFYKNAKLNAEKTELTLEPVSDKGPIITFITPDYSPLDGEYIWLDAAIDAPISPIAPRIEMYWLTRLHPDFVKRERFTYAKASVNDGKFHRYLLSCRSNGWTTSGSMRCIVLGFPARSKVRINGIGITRQKSLPTLSPVLENVADANATRFTPPYYDYPLEPQLGLIALSDKADAINADYSVKDISGADGVLAEITYPNQSFDDANSDHLSGQTYKTYRFKGAEGKIQIPTNELPSAGVYSLRVIATSPEGPYLGQFSDALSYQVPRVKKEY